MCDKLGIDTETPPRAWGRPISVAEGSVPAGNTPTGVGKTYRPPPPWATIWKHPHGRGEDEYVMLSHCLASETPPRAWGRRNHLPQGQKSPRNTPTGVGKTGGVEGCGMCTQKHPHGRGEDLYPARSASRIIETPPRAWGRQRPRLMKAGKIRNTPTGVGKTNMQSVSITFYEKHPHGRGEDKR